MKFHRYDTVRDRWRHASKRIARNPKTDLAPWVSLVHDKKLSDDGFRQAVNSAARQYHSQKQPNLVQQYSAACFDEVRSWHYWVKDDRPYYNVWPVVLDMKVDLSSVKLCDVKFPFDVLVLRHSANNHQSTIKSVIVHTSCDETGALKNLTLRIIEKNTLNVLWWSCKVDGERSVEEHLNYSLLQELNVAGNTTDTTPEEKTKLADQTRLAVVVSMLHQDEDCVSRVVLEKDLPTFEQTSDELLKEKILDRAKQRNGKGYDVGKKMSEKSGKIRPHYRNAHLAIFHTGPGRRTPILKLRKGAVIKSDLDKVPSGFLGSEKEGEHLENQTWIYFMQSGDSARVKIGRSDTVEQRRDELQTGNPDKLTILGKIRGTPDLEGQLQELFKKDHIRGEFYALSPELRAFIEEHAET